MSAEELPGSETNVPAAVKIFPRIQTTSQEFALLIEKCMTASSGVLYGCELTASSATELAVNSGWVLVRGRIVRVEEGVITVSAQDVIEREGSYYASSTEAHTATSYIAVRVDLMNEDSPGAVVSDLAEGDMVDTPDFNVPTGSTSIAYCILATYSFSRTRASITDEWPDWSLNVTPAEKIMPLYENGRTIYTRTTGPSAALGSDGDLWFQYDA